MPKNGNFDFLFLLSILFILIIKTNSLNDIFFSCNGRIYSDFNGLSINELNSLCTLITQDDRFVIYLTNSIYFPDEASYTATSHAFFSNQCTKNSVKCEYNFAIAIYPNVGKVFIIAGNIIKNYVNQSQRMTVINSMINDLRYSKYYSAISNGIFLLRSYYKYSPSSEVRHDTDRDNKSEGFGFFSILLFIICPICCCIGLIYIIYHRNKEEVIEQTDTLSTQIHMHLCELEEMIKEIRKNSPPIISINKCLICMQTIDSNLPEGNQYKPQEIEMTRMGQNDMLISQPQYTQGFVDTENTRFACQHIYHNNCLQSHTLTCCLMCIGNVKSRETVPNTYFTQVVNEGHIKTFIQNLNYIYHQNELNEYSATYPAEYDTFNTTLLLGLGAAWGINAPTTVINMNTYNYNNDIYGQNPIPDNSHYSPGDVTVGMYEPPNINTSVEMTEINNYPPKPPEGVTGANYTNNNPWGETTNHFSTSNHDVDEGNFGGDNVDKGDYNNEIDNDNGEY